LTKIREGKSSHHIIP